MIKSQLLLFDSGANAFAKLWGGGAWNEVLALFGAIVIVTIPILIWAVFVRKRKRTYGLTDHQHRHRHHRHRRHRDSESPGSTQTAGTENKESSRKRRRRRHRSMNPTLAQTGGLPPARPDAEEPGPVRAE